MADVTRQLVDLYGGAVALAADGVTVRDPARLRSAATDRLAWRAVFADRDEREAARWLLWELGQATGARPASINELYHGAGAGRMRGVHRARDQRADDGLRHRPGHLPRRAGGQGRGHHPRDRAIGDRLHRAAPAEYVAVMIARRPAGGIHPARCSFRATTARSTTRSTQADPEGEVGEVKKLIAEEVGAGFYNIDVDTSTLVDLAQPTPGRAAAANYERAAEITAFIREHGAGRASPSRWAAEIGEVGHEEQHRGGAARLHAGLQPDAWRPMGGPRASARSRSRPGPRTAGWCYPTDRSRT